VSETGAPLLEWRIEPTPDATILHTTGEVDLSTQPDFTDAVRTAAQTPAPAVVINLSRVTFIGSTGMQVLLDLNHEMTRTARQLRVAYGPSHARRAFEIAGIQHVLAVYDTLEEALVFDNV
jgi:anti-sigma B factor antagonist